METLFILNSLKFYVSLTLLLIIFIHQLKTKKLNIKIIKWSILSILIIFISISSYATFSTYNSWKQDPISKFLLPPYNSSYFYSYVFFHFWKPFLIIIIISISWTAFLLLLKKYSNNKLLNKKEIYLGFFTSLSIGFPLFIVYIFTLFFIFSIQHIINIIIFKNNNPIIITHSMLASTIIVLLSGNDIINKFGLTALRI